MAEEWKIKYATGKGNREHNEDRHLAQVFDGGRLLLVVCDGMGGHNFGRVAAELAVRTVKIYFISHVLRHKDDHYCDNLIISLEYTFSAFIRENPKFKGMGTTLAMAYAGKKHVCCLWAGDSRIYFFRKGEIEFMSRDHNLATELVNEGLLKKGTLEYESRKGTLTNCIMGSHRPSGHSYHEIKSVRKNDRILVCSDGVTDLLDKEEISKRIAGEELGKAAGYLEALCRQRGDDNWTFIIAEKA